MNTKTIYRIGVQLLGILLLPACVWDNVEEFYPDSGVCDTTSVSFSTNIIPVLTSNCFTCHSNANAPISGGGLSFEDYQDVVNYSDRIIGAINHREGYLPMPRGSDKLGSCSILLFEAWVNSDTPDN